MPIAIHDDNKTTPLVEEPFKDEAELQGCLERSPFLLVSESEPPVATVGRELSLPSAGILDLLAVDKEGLPVAVEVKLARNAQSRRQVVAQAFDYVADLSKLDFDALDDLVDGALAGALEKLVTLERIVAVRKQCAANLRTGRIRLVIAVDSAPDDLIRIVRDLRDNRHIDVRLVSVSKSKFEEKRILVPRILVAPASEPPARGRRVAGGSRLPECAVEPAVRGRRVGGAKEPDPAFLAVVGAYDRTAEEQWRTRHRARNRRGVRRDQWPRGVHYVFVNYPDEVGIELHLQSDEVCGLAAHLSPLSGQELAPGILAEWDPGFSHNLGRLVAKVGKGQSPEVGARAMQALIARTRDIVENYLKTREVEPIA
jgi:hypothetical protein